MPAGEHYLCAEPADFPPALQTLAAMDEDRLQGVVAAARSFVETRLSWEVIARELLDTIGVLAPSPAGEAALDYTAR